MPRIAPEVIVWTDAQRAELAAAIVGAMGADVKTIGVGGPRVTEVDDLARALDCPRGDDLRKLVVERPASFLLLTSLADAGEEELAAAAAEDTTILTLEPLAADLPDLVAMGEHSAKAGDPARSIAARAAFVPAFTQSPGFFRATDPQEALGHGRLLTFESCGRPETGSLFSRLYDAWHTLLGFSPLPDLIDASITGTTGPLPDDLRRITGRLAAHARIPPDSNAVLQISDAASDQRRYLHVISGSAELRITDSGYDLRQSNGTVVDRREASPEGIPFVDLVVAQWRRLLDRPGLSPIPSPPGRDADALACCIASLLSARTGQPESPRKLIAIGA